MKQDKLQRKVKFYDPHPGFGGALKPLPMSMINIARELDGKKMTLEEAMEKISPIARRIDKGEIGIVDDMNYICFEFKSGIFTHYYCLIKYKK